MLFKGHPLKDMTVKWTSSGKADEVLVPKTETREKIIGDDGETKPDAISFEFYSNGQKEMVNGQYSISNGNWFNEQAKSPEVIDLAGGK